jgi:hypothetical protein
MEFRFHELGGGAEDFLLPKQLLVFQDRLLCWCWYNFCDGARRVNVVCVWMQLNSEFIVMVGLNGRR